MISDNSAAACLSLLVLWEKTLLEAITKMFFKASERQEGLPPIGGNKPQPLLAPLHPELGVFLFSGRMADVRRVTKNHSHYQFSPHFLP